MCPVALYRGGGGKGDILLSLFVCPSVSPSLILWARINHSSINHDSLPENRQNWKAELCPYSTFVAQNKAYVKWEPWHSFIIVRPCCLLLLTQVIKCSVVFLILVNRVDQVNWRVIWSHLLLSTCYSWQKHSLNTRYWKLLHTVVHTRN